MNSMDRNSNYSNTKTLGAVIGVAGSPISTDKADNKNSSKRLRRTLRLTLYMLLILFISLGTATYAWFTSGNHAVRATKVDAKTGSMNLKLLLSTSTSFPTESTETALTSVLKNGIDASKVKLLPVSTSDLSSFVWGNAIDGTASHFKAATDNDDTPRYYHGQVYMKATGTNLGDSVKQAAVYLNGIDSEANNGNPLSGASDGFTNSVRVGLRFTGNSGSGTSETVIFRLTSDVKNSDKGEMNTTVNGKALMDSGYVISSSVDSSTSTVNSISAIGDPSIYYSNYVVTSTSTPTNPLITLNLEEAYLVDVYVYLEGCDPDCLEDLAAEKEGDITLWFYALPA